MKAHDCFTATEQLAAGPFTYTLWLHAGLGRLPGPRAFMPPHGDGEAPGAGSDADDEVGSHGEDHPAQRQRDAGQDQRRPPDDVARDPAAFAPGVESS